MSPANRPDPPAGIDWHRHQKGWVWGVFANDGCELCDAADKWLAAQTPQPARPVQRGSVPTRPTAPTPPKSPQRTAHQAPALFR